jgi:DNA anti-recombination protein RmuC
MRFVLLLALLPSLAFADGGYLMDQAARQDSLQTLNEVESNLLSLKNDLQKAIDYSQKLDERLTLALSSLQKSEESLTKARLNLTDSETALEEAQSALTEASTALQESEQSWKDYRFWSDVKVYFLAVVAVVCAVGWAVW